MKLKTLKTKRYTLLRLHLLRFQTYKCLNKKSFFNSIKHLELRLKQILQLIYLYHYNNKKILFIGFPYSKSKFISGYSKHIFIPKKMYSGRVLAYKNDINLIVIFNLTKKDTLILKELSDIKKPTVFLGNSNEIKILNKFTYSINSFIINKNFKQFCHFLMCTILKQPQLVK